MHHPYIGFVFLPLIDEPDFGSVEKGKRCKASLRMEDISIKSGVIVVNLQILGVQSMQDATVAKHLHPVAKKLCHLSRKAITKLAAL